MITHRTLPKFIADRGGVALRPGDGIIHSWLNRMLLPDEVGTGAAAWEIPDIKCDYQATSSSSPTNKYNRLLLHGAL